MNTAPPSIALALMAAELATQRTYGPNDRAVDWLSVDGRIQLVDRRDCVGRATREYYQIIDRIARGERP